MRRFIELKDGEARRKICETYGVTSMALSHALNYRRNSRQCIAMRRMALENGGREYELKPFETDKTDKS